MNQVLLAFPRIDSFSKLLEYHFKRRGLGSETVCNSADFFRQLEPKETNLVILDASLEEAPELSKLLKCDRATSKIPLIQLFPKGKDPHADFDFLIEGDRQVHEPFEVGHLLSLSAQEVDRFKQGNVPFEQSVRIRIATGQDQMDQAIEVIDGLIRQSGLSEDVAEDMVTAFREAIGNAAQHGNRYDPDKKVEVFYGLDSEALTIRVADQGDGFDHQKYLHSVEAKDPISQARQRYKDGELGGLGIMMMLRTCDRVEYNAKGNEVVLTKRRASKNGESAD